MTGSLEHIECEDVRAPKPFCAFEEIKPKPLLRIEYFLRHLVTINCASVATEIMVFYVIQSWYPEP
jgi:hypothetical protein